MPDPLAGWPGAWPGTEPAPRAGPRDAARVRSPRREEQPSVETLETNDTSAGAEQGDAREEERVE